MYNYEAALDHAAAIGWNACYQCLEWRREDELVDGLCPKCRAELEGSRPVWGDDDAPLFGDDEITHAELDAIATAEEA